MNHKKITAVAVFLVLIQIFLLFLPIVRTTDCVREWDWYGNQSAIDIIGDCENIVMIGELREEWGTGAVIGSAVACLGTLALIAGALLCLTLALIWEEAPEYQLPLLRNASCLLCAVPVLNCIMQYIIMMEWEGHALPTVFGVALMLTPLCFISLHKKLEASYPKIDSES